MEIVAISVVFFMNVLILSVCFMCLHLDNQTRKNKDANEKQPEQDEHNEEEGKKEMSSDYVFSCDSNDNLIVDFSRIPKGYDFVTMDKNGLLKAFVECPCPLNDYWRNEHGYLPCSIYLGNLNDYNYSAYRNYNRDFFNHLWVRGIGYVKFDDYLESERQKRKEAALLKKLEECESLSELKATVKEKFGVR